MQSTYRHQTFTEKAMIVLALAVVALVLWKLVGLLLLIFGAVVGACILQTCMNPLLDRGMPRWLALLIVVVGLILLLAGISLAFGSQVTSELESLTSLLPDAWQQLRERLQDTPLEPLMDNAGERAGSMFENGIAQFGMVVVSMGGSLVNFFALFVGMIYFAAQPQVYRHGLLLLAPIKSRDKLAGALDASGKALRHWLGGQLIAMASTGFLVGVSMWLIGVPAPLGLGLIAGVLDFVPLVGPLIAAVPALLLAYTVSPQTALFALIAYVIIQQIEGNVLQPLVQQHAVSLPPAMLLFSLFAASTLFGVAGVLLAAPLTVIGFVLINELYVQREEGDHNPVE
ncbi:MULTISPECIES: AI-2E family transporter [unclassified Halomonas]|uniref:AI-2E family transporter n=1 Tax=unclassified Halomonas TaxID=2609666 RepID=UPI0021E398FB|nr:MULTISPECIES: AI-2E family transporter [unclassified Halomonas]UYF99401.1 AI-2E family transporter [Halomonas sp. GD1P12]WNL39484.1 AI-2E family transporter [Halomonas sp. PAMB 3232]WNL42853.1 AI-2E family transporter [Halomonas sp. PAMB 3264]